MTTHIPNRFILAASIAVLVAAEANGQLAATNWLGDGADSNWSTGANWDAGVPGGNIRDLYFGLGFEGNPAGLNATSANNNLAAYQGHRFTFEGGSSTPFTITGLSFSLLDFAGAAPRIQNDSAALQTFNLGAGSVLTLNGTNGGNKAVINANSGDLLFSATTGIALAGTTQLQISGNAGLTVSFNGVISGANSVAIAGGTNVVFGAVNTFSGDTFINNGNLSFAGAGTNGSGVVRLGDTSGTAGATVSLGNFTGGQTIASVLNTRAGASGLKALASLAASGTNTWSGNILLDDDLTTSSQTGGTLVLSGAQIDLKNRTLTVDGDGNTTISGPLQNSTGTGKILKTGAGVLSLGSINTFGGGTTVNAGTVRALAAGAIPAAGGLTVAAGFNATAALDLNGFNLSPSNLTFGGSGTNAIGTGAGTLTLTRDIVFDTTNSPQTSSVSGKLELGASRIFNIGDSASTTTEALISAVISGTGFGITKTGAGTLALGGANTFTGPVTVNAGTLAVRAVNTLNVTPQINAGATLLFDTPLADIITFNNILGAASNGISVDGGTIRAAMQTTVSVDRTLTNRLITIGAGGVTFDIAGAYPNFNEGIFTQLRFVGTNLSGAGTVTKTGGGRIQFQTTNPNFSGPIVINDGTVEAPGVALGNASATNTITLNGGNWAVTGGISTQPSVTLNGGAMSTNGGNQTVTGTVNITAGSYVFLNNFWVDIAPAAAWNMTLPNVVSGSGDLLVGVNRPAYSFNSGSLILQNTANSISGTLTVGKGVGLTSSAVSGVGSTLGTASVVLAGGKLNLRDNGPGSNATLAYGTNVSVIAPTGLAANGVLTGNATLDVNRAFGTNIGNAFQLGTLTLGLPQLDVVGGNFYGVRFNGLTTFTDNVTFNTVSASLTLAGGISSGGFGFTKTGPGTLRILGATSIPAYTLAAGTLELPTEPAAGRSLDLPLGVGFGAGYAATQANLIDHVTLTSAGVIALGVDSTFNPNFTGFSGGLRLGGTANATLIGTITPADGTMRLGGGGGNLTLVSTDAVSGAVNLDLNVNGTTPGTVALVASNNFSGTISIAGGMALRVGSKASMGTGVGPLNFDNGILQLTNGGDFSGLNARVFNAGPGGATLDTAGISLNLDTAITGTGSFAKAGAGALTLTSTAASFTGKTIVRGGSLVIAADANLGAVPGVVTADQIQLAGGTLSVTGAITIPLNRGIALGTGGGTIEVTGANTVTLASTMSGANAFTKEGSGTLLITADPNPTGLYTVNNGVLALQHGGSTDASIVINNSGTLRVLTANDLGDAFNITVNAGGTFDLRASDTIAQLLGGGLVKNDSAAATTLTVNSAVNGTFSGVLQNGVSTLGFSKTGLNTVTLSGVNTYTGATLVNQGTLAIQGISAALGNTILTIGDNNGADERAIFGQTTDVWTGGALNRLGDTGSIILNASSLNGLTYNGPATGSSGTVETIGSLQFSNGRNFATLVAGTGADVQLTSGSLTRLNQGTGVIRGANLGGTGVGSTRLFLGSTAALVGAGGADGSTTKSIVPFVLGDTSIAGNGTGFLTHDPINGLRLLSPSEYSGTLAGSTPLRNVSLSGGEILSSSPTVNSIRVVGGSTTINAAQNVRLQSGAILFTGAGSLDGAGVLDAGASDAIISIANDTTTSAAVNARIAAAGGVTLSSFGAGANVITLGGDNDIFGNVVVNAATLRLGSSKALNDNYPATVLLRPSSTFQLNGFDVTTRNLQAAAGAGVIQNGGATAATLTSYLTAAQSVLTPVTNGGAGALNLIVSGGQTLTFGATNTYTGSTELRSGTLLLSGSATGTINNTAAVLISGSTLRLTNTSAANSGTRVPDTAPVSFNGGTLDFDNNASALSFSETVGASTLSSGANTITVDKAATGQTSVLTLASLTRTPGAVLNFNSQNNGAAIFDLGTTGLSRLVISAAPVPDDGIMGGWATIDSGANTREFAKYVGTGIISVTALVAGDYKTSLTSGPNAVQNVKLTASPGAALTSNTEINALNVAQASATAIDLGAGNTLRVESGGVIVSGPFNAAFTNGTLTTGNGAASGGDLIFHTLPFASSGLAWSNAADTVTLANVANGTPIVFTTVPGGLTAGTIYYAVNSTGTTFQAALTPNGAVVPITTDGTTGALNQFFTTSVSSVISDNGANPINFVKAGGGIVTLSGANTFSGKTYLTGGTVRIDNDGNLGTAPAAPVGDALVLSGGSTLEVTSSFTLNANRGLTIGAGSNVISLGAGTAGAGKTLTYNGAIASLGTTEGSLQFRSNVISTNVDPGKIAATLSALNLNGSFRVDAGTVTLSAATNSIGRSLQIGMDGSGTLNATVPGGRLQVGKGINDTLDVGVNTSNGATTIGILNLAGLDQFSANVDLVRVGFAGTGFAGLGTLTLATNNDITAGTSITLGGTASAGNATVTSALIFGAGINNIATRTFIAGGDKSRANVTVASGGIVNLNGFGANTMDLFVGNYLSTGTAGATSTFDLSAGTLNASLNTLAVGQKTLGTSGGVLGIMTLAGSANNVSANAVILGRIDSNNAAGSNVTAGTLNFGGGTMNVNNDVSLALLTNNTVGTPISNGTFNLTGGTVLVGGNITTSNTTSATATFNLDGGTLDLTNGIINVDVFNAKSGTLRNLAQLQNGDGATAAALTKTTVGTLIIDGVNTFTGGTNVNAGTLLVNGSISGTLNVSAGAILGGNGLIAGAVTMADGSTLAPGNGPGVLNSGNVSFGAGTLAIELASPSSFDQLNVTGSVSINAPVTFTLAVLTSFTNGTAFTLINNDGADAVALLDSNSRLVFNGTPLDEGAIFTVTGGFGSQDFKLSYAGGSNANDVMLVAVPEPGSAAALLSGFATLLGLRRFRRGTRVRASSKMA